jgi:hypothetical protein
MRFNALLGKAQLRKQQGDRAASLAILKQAERIAPSPTLRQQVQQMLQAEANSP